MKYIYYYLFPILLFCLFIPFSSEIDLSLSKYFFNSEDQSFTSSTFIYILYRYVVLLGVLVSISGLFIFIAGFFVDALKKLRLPALYLVLTMLIGSGAVVHCVFKDHWGRPRPKDTIEFGGDHPFRPCYSPDFTNNRLKSFPSGHSSTGYYFFSLYFLSLRYRRKKMAYLFFATACILGGLLSYARIAAGGHFFSDTLFSALIMWMSALCINDLMHNYWKKNAER